MAAVPVQGDLKGFILRYVLRVENMGDVPLQNVQISNDFTPVFQGAEFEVIQKDARGTLSLNPDYDGAQNIDLAQYFCRRTCTWGYGKN